MPRKELPAIIYLGIEDRQSSYPPPSLDGIQIDLRRVLDWCVKTTIDISKEYPKIDMSEVITIIQLNFEESLKGYADVEVIYDNQG